MQCNQPFNPERFLNSLFYQWLYHVTRVEFRDYRKTRVNFTTWQTVKMT